jgi:phenylpyruvate tautomerase PptA (4-oxalocrotonate tautomerase family)
MPHYAVLTSITLDHAQRSALAKGLTNLHCSTFSALPLFVNVTFHDSVPTFVAGREAQTNYIHAYIRPRPLSPSTISGLTNSISDLWDQTVLRPQYASSDSSPHPRGSLLEPYALHNVFIMQTISGGAEQGFILPQAGSGGDGDWLAENMSEFEARAKAGDEGMKELLDWVKARKG